MITRIMNVQARARPTLNPGRGEAVSSGSVRAAPTAGGWFEAVVDDMVRSSAEIRGVGVADLVLDERDDHQDDQEGYRKR
ncbi:hypothetical protein GCM10025862_30780 [Arsenicicoccus piscis]|uniref:Uncharacterized protein n=1 Tax=Arsenicicoccus piscis TaxID=673954 RepID=A0ABQ6HRT8_9MICO|nr:hypothetical protein GCM10025862_30780 [Arsenicicoccus piscis]